MPTVTNAPTPPLAPADGDLWFNTTTGREFVWYIGASGAQWVQTQPSGSMIPTPHADPGTPPSPPVGTPYDVSRVPTITVSPVAPTTPLVGDLWWSPVTGQTNVWYDDGNTVQWVIANWGAGKPGPPGPPGGVSVVHEGDDITITGTSVDPIIGVTPGAFVRPPDLDPYALLDSPSFIGNPTAPTPAPGDNDTSIATTAFVGAAITAINVGQYAPIASPTFTGDPKAPTPATADNDTSIATTAFVKNQGYVTAAGAAAAAPVQSVAGKTGAVTLVKGDVGLGNVDNTSDVNKPISTAQQAALDLKAPLASPALTGTPTAPITITGSNVNNRVSTIADWVNQLNLMNYAPTNNPTFTGDPKAPTPATSDNDTSIATTAFVRSAISTYSPPPDLSGYAPLASPTFTGDPKAPTPAPGDNDTSVATTAFVAAAIAANPGGAVIGTSPPGSPTVGTLWWKSDDGTLFLYYNDGNTLQWVPAAPSAATASPFPPGYVGEFAGTVVPDGWYEMDGSMKTTAGDPALFAAIGYTYGGSGANFAVPDARGRATIGHDPGGTAGRVTNAGSSIHGETLGAVGGDQNMPSHGHGAGSLHGAGLVGNNLVNGTSRAVGTGDGVNSGYFQDVNISGSTASAGAGASANMPPVIVFKKMIKR